MPLRLHVPPPFVSCALARKGGLGGLAPRAGGLGSLPAAKTSLLPWAGRRPPPTLRLGGKVIQTPPCAQARMARTAREHEVLMARNTMSNHTDMQDKYCGNCYDIHPIQSQYTKVAAVGRHHKRGGAAFGRATSFVVSFVCALNGASILALSTIYDLRLMMKYRSFSTHFPCLVHAYPIFSSARLRRKFL